MSASVFDGLIVDVASPVHRLAPIVKVVATLTFLLAVVATPARQVWAFGAFVLLLAVGVALARLPARHVLARFAIETPFLLFAVLMPFLGTGDEVQVAGVSLSVPGLWGAWTLLAKGTLGVAASIVLVSTTPIPDLLDALHRLRVPRAFLLIAGLMVRYLDVVVGEVRRLQVARTSRGDDPRWLWQGRAVAATAGTLFVRSYERGERVHQAMLARGFDGTVPAPTDTIAPRWLPALLLPAAALGVMAGALASSAGT